MAVQFEDSIFDKGSTSDPRPVTGGGAGSAASTSAPTTGVWHYVEIPEEVGNWTTDIKNVSNAQQIAQGAAYGSALGSIVPGIGNVAGTAIGASVYAVGSWLGFISSRDDVRDIMRGLLAEAFSSAFPGEVLMAGTARTKPVLTGQFRLQDIDRAIRQIGASVVNALPDGSDAKHDIGEAFRSFRITKVEDAPPGKWWTVMQFQAIESVIQNGSVQSGAAAKPGIAGIGIFGLALALFGK